MIIMQTWLLQKLICMCYTGQKALRCEADDGYSTDGVANYIHSNDLVCHRQDTVGLWQLYARFKRELHKV